MAMNMIIYRRTKIYPKGAVSDTDTIYFNQAVKGNDATQFLREAQKQFMDLLSKGIFELIPCIIFKEGGTLLPALLYTKKKDEYKQGIYTSIRLDSI